MDPVELERTMQRLRPMLVAVARQRVGDRGEDVVQNVFLATWRRRDTLEADRVGSYLRTALRNRIRNEYRAAEKREEYIESWPEDRDGVQVPLTDPDAEDPEQGYLTTEAEHWLKDAIDQLPERQARLVRAFYFDGLSYNEIRAKYCLSKGAIKGRLYRARENLQDMLEGSYRDYVT